MLVELFESRFDPDRSDDAEEAQRRLADEISVALSDVASLDEDRILSTLPSPRAGDDCGRNWYQDRRSTRRSSSIPHGFPTSRCRVPLFEVWVYSPRCEGVHLRGGPIARGGIRWSDRREDFRTEVLGLMKAQMVKNAVIVPVGAKGGFVVKRPPATPDRELLQAEVVACYQILIRGMLDVTDNIVGDTVAPPPRVVRYDGDDPYLVVAADKGTATFSDLANSIAAEYGFWLGDAFASGGSAGYDHKKMAITARGAWESVRRHFLHLGLDPDTDRFTVAGHWRHVGRRVRERDAALPVDAARRRIRPPARVPRPAARSRGLATPSASGSSSCRDRRGTTTTARSSRKAAGCGREAPSPIALSPEARALLCVEAETLTPSEVISALLKAPVDLSVQRRCRHLREGVHRVARRRRRPRERPASRRRRRPALPRRGGRRKSRLHAARPHRVRTRRRSDQHRRDRQLSRRRLLRPRGEHQDPARRRRRGGRPDTEAAQRHPRRDGGRGRSPWCSATTTSRTAALANARAQAESMVDVHARYIRSLEHEDLIDRILECLPTDRQLSERQSAGVGLTSPEFAVLLAYTKTTNVREVLASEPARRSFRRRRDRHLLPEPSPRALPQRDGSSSTAARDRRHADRERHRQQGRHLLRLPHDRGDGGHRRRQHPGPHRGAGDLLDAALWAPDRGARRRRRSPDVQLRMLLALRRMVERGALWLLRHRRPPLDITATVAAFRDGGTRALRGHPATCCSASTATSWRNRRRLRGGRRGIARWPSAAAALGAQFSGDRHHRGRAGARGLGDRAAAVFFALADRLGVDWIRDRVLDLPRDNEWQTLARAALRDDLQLEQRELTAEVLRMRSAGDEAYALVDVWIASKSGAGRPVSVRRSPASEPRGSTTSRRSRSLSGSCGT